MKNQMAMAKMNEMIGNPVVQQMYEQLVLTKTVSEEEFWEKQEKVQEYILLRQSLDQPLAKSVLSLSVIQEEEKSKLLKRESQLMALYNKQVTHGHTTHN